MKKSVLKESVKFFSVYFNPIDDNIHKYLMKGT